MRQLMTSYKRPDVRKIAIVFTDGDGNVDERKTISEAEEAKREGIDIFVVGESDFRVCTNKEYIL